MQEQMSSMNDSGEFQEVESNYSGTMSHVSSQLAMIPSSRAHHKENEDQFHKQQGRRLYSQEMTNIIETQFQCRRLQEGRRL